MPTSLEYALAYVKAGADLRAAVSGMTRDQLVARPIPGKWSTLEVVAHIADFDPILVDRMKRIIATPDAVLLAADENLFAAELHYQDRDVDEELAVIEATRKSMGRLIAKLTPVQLAKTGMHSLKGPMTLEKIVGMGAGHITHHLPFIAAKRAALGL